MNNLIPRLIPENERMNALELNGLMNLPTVPPTLMFDNLVFSVMDEIAPDYSGGYWHYLELVEEGDPSVVHGFLMVPAGEENLSIINHGLLRLQQTIEMSPYGAGMVATTMALNKLAWHMQSKDAPNEAIERIVNLQMTIQDHAADENDYRVSRDGVELFEEEDNDLAADYFMAID